MSADGPRPIVASGVSDQRLCSFGGVAAALKVRDDAIGDLDRTQRVRRAGESGIADNKAARSFDHGETKSPRIRAGGVFERRQPLR